MCCETLFLFQGVFFQHKSVFSSFLSTTSIEAKVDRKSRASACFAELKNFPRAYQSDIDRVQVTASQDWRANNSLVESVSGSVSQSVNQSVSQSVSQLVNQLVNQLNSQSVSQTVSQSVSCKAKYVWISYFVVICDNLSD